MVEKLGQQLGNWLVGKMVPQMDVLMGDGKDAYWVAWWASTQVAW